MDKELLNLIIAKVITVSELSEKAQKEIDELLVILKDHIHDHA